MGRWSEFNVDMTLQLRERARSGGTNATSGESYEVFGVDFIGEFVATSIIGSARPKLIVSVDVANDESVAVEESIDGSGEVGVAGGLGRDVYVD